MNNEITAIRVNVGLDVWDIYVPDVDKIIKTYDKDCNCILSKTAYPCKNCGMQDI